MTYEGINKPPNWAKIFRSLSAPAQQSLGELFINGPIGPKRGITSSQELQALDLIFRDKGWISLTPAGVQVAVGAEILPPEAYQLTPPTLPYGLREKWRWKQRDS